MRVILKAIHGKKTIFTFHFQVSTNFTLLWDKPEINPHLLLHSLFTLWKGWGPEKSLPYWPNKWTHTVAICCIFMGLHGYSVRLLVTYFLFIDETWNHLFFTALIMELIIINTRKHQTLWKTSKHFRVYSLKKDI